MSIYKKKEKNYDSIYLSVRLASVPHSPLHRFKGDFVLPNLC